MTRHYATVFGRVWEDKDLVWEFYYDEDTHRGYIERVLTTYDEDDRPIEISSHCSQKITKSMNIEKWITKFEIGGGSVGLTIRW